MFLAIAGTALQSLTCPASEVADTFNGAVIARFTGLTELHLANVYFTPGFTALRSLPLQSLSLLYCRGVDEELSHLFVPGALTALRKLQYFEDPIDFMVYDDRLRSMEHASPEAQQWRQNILQQLREVGDIVLNLPNLVELSGQSRLLRYGIKDGQNGWKCNKYCSYSRG